VIEFRNFSCKYLAELPKPLDTHQKLKVAGGWLSEDAISDGLEDCDQEAC
jgi:hypothetical protein